MFCMSTLSTIWEEIPRNFTYHCIQSDVRSFCIDCCKKEERYAHESRRSYHGLGRGQHLFRVDRIGLRESTLQKGNPRIHFRYTWQEISDTYPFATNSWDHVHQGT